MGFVHNSQGAQMSAPIPVENTSNVTTTLTPPRPLVGDCQRPTYPLLLPPPALTSPKNRLFKRRTKSALQLHRSKGKQTTTPGTSATLPPGSMPGTSNANAQNSDSPSTEDPVENGAQSNPSQNLQGSATRLRGGPGRISIFFGKVRYGFQF